jgi:hypothetical protein
MEPSVVFNSEEEVIKSYSTMAKVDHTVLYLSALVVLMLSCSWSESRPWVGHSKKKLVERHVNRVYSFGCKEPQLRLVQLKDLGVTVRPEMSYYPRATVLRRCDCATGFCANPEYSCSANETAEVELVFSVRNQVGKAHENYMSVSATEHISCSCQPITNQIK